MINQKTTKNRRSKQCLKMTMIFDENDYDKMEEKKKGELNNIKQKKFKSKQFTSNSFS